MHYTESRTIQQGKSLEGTAMSPNEHTAKTEYLSIGKVAKEKNISIKALRYYDEIGVFLPNSHFLKNLERHVSKAEAIIYADN